MRKRSAYRPKGVNPAAWAVAMQGAMLLSRDDQASRAMRMYCALEAIRTGEARQEDWREVFDACNLIEALSHMPRVMRGAREFVEHTQEVIVAILDRQRETGTKALKADELAALRELAGLWTEVLGAVTHAEFCRAHEQVSERIQRVLGGREPNVRVIEAA